MPNITSVRRLLALAGALLVLLGVVLLPLVVPAVLAAWAGQLLTIAGWTALVLAAGPFSARLVRPAIVLSAILSGFIGFAIIFGVPLLGDDAPRTLGLVAVLLALLTLGWLFRRGVGRVTLLLTAALAGVAALGQLLIWLAALLGPGSALLLPPPGLDNATRWTTLTFCALIAAVLGVRRLDLS